MKIASGDPSQPQSIVRKELLRAVLAESHRLTEVDIREIRLAPGQSSGRHLHPCTVIGFVVEGAAVLQVEGEAEINLPAGSAFHEPRGRIIARFDNASAEAPMRFLACYLLDGEQDLITMLPEDQM